MRPPSSLTHSFYSHDHCTDALDKSPPPSHIMLDTYLHYLTRAHSFLTGVICAIVMERLMKEFPDLIDYIDMAAGCSNGATLGTLVLSHFSVTLIGKGSFQSIP